MGFESIDQPGWSSEVEQNPKMSISCFWLERHGGWGSGPFTSPAGHQKLNVIKNWAFHSLVGEGWQMGFEFINQPGRSSEANIIQKQAFHFFSSPLTSPASHQKLNIIKIWAFHFFGWRQVVDRVWVHWPAWLIISSEHNPKRSISFYWLESGGGWGLSPLTSLANIRSWT